MKRTNWFASLFFVICPSLVGLVGHHRARFTHSPANFTQHEQMKSNLSLASSAPIHLRVISAARRALNYTASKKSSFRTSGTLSYYIDVRYRASTFEDFCCIVLHRTTWDCQRLHCTKHPLNDTKRHVKSNSLDGASYIELSPQRWPILHTRSHTTSIIGLPDPIFIGSILVFLRVCTIGLSEARRAN